MKMGPSYLFNKEDDGLTMRERRRGDPARPAFGGGWPPKGRKVLRAPPEGSRVPGFSLEQKSRGLGPIHLG